MSCIKRLRKEFKDWTENPVPGIVAGPVSEDNYMQWNAWITGPEGTPYEDGMFHCTLDFPSKYPLVPPKLHFVSKIWHPNVYESGEVCISILHQGEDVLGYEMIEERWSPVQTVKSILLSVLSMLADPNDESGANLEAAKEFRDDPESFEVKCRECVELSLGLS